MKIVFALILCGFVFSSCSSTYYVQQNDTENNIDKINNLSKTYTPLVKLVDGTEFSTDALKIKDDSLFVLTSGYEIFPLDIVSSIELRDVSRGFFDGVFMGIPVAVLTGVIAASDDEMNGTFALAIMGLTYAVTVAVNTFFSGNKTFVFNRENDNSFTRIE
jgi:hypothetical protein